MNATWNGITSLAVCRGRASAKFFGTSSPRIIESSVAMTIAMIARDRSHDALGQARAR